MILDEVNIPESLDTLLAQQEQLIAGKRKAQMFPLGTYELPVPPGCERVVTPRGVFHYNPKMLTDDNVILASKNERENLILNLGPFNKHDIIGLYMRGDTLYTITEYNEKDVELRTAIAADSTLKEQIAYFMKTKEPGSRLHIGSPEEILLERTTSPAARPGDPSANPSDNTSQSPARSEYSISAPEGPAPEGPEPSSFAERRKSIERP